MADAFSITTASGTIDLDANRQSGANFSVTNVSGHAIQAHGRVVAEAPAAAGWFTIEGAAERNFPAGGTEVYRVEVKVPATAPPATPTDAPKTYRFRLDVLGTENPDEEQAQGQWVDFTVKPPSPQRRPIPWLWISVAAAALVVIVGAGVTVWILTHRQSTLTPSSDTVNFGTVALSTTATRTVTVKNAGPVDTTVNATVSGQKGGGVYSVNGSACLGHVLNPNAVCVFTVTFKPTGKGAVTGSLQITGDHAGTKTVALTGAGGQSVATASPSPIHLSCVETGTGVLLSCSGTTTITDTGDTSLHVSSVSVSANLSMVIQQDTCLGKAVGPQQNCTITFATVAQTIPFRPSGTLTISSDAAPLSVPFS